MLLKRQNALPIFWDELDISFYFLHLFSIQKKTRCLCKGVFFKVLITVATKHFKFHSSSLAKRITFFEIMKFHPFNLFGLQLQCLGKKQKWHQFGQWLDRRIITLVPRGERVLRKPFLIFVNISQTIDFSYTLKYSMEAVEENGILTASALASLSFKTEVFRLRVCPLQEWEASIFYRIRSYLLHRGKLTYFHDELCLRFELRKEESVPCTKPGDKDTIYPWGKCYSKACRTPTAWSHSFSPSCSSLH